MDGSKPKVFCGVESDLHRISRSVMGEAASERDINCKSVYISTVLFKHTDVNTNT